MDGKVVKKRHFVWRIDSFFIVLEGNTSCFSVDRLNQAGEAVTYQYNLM